MRSRNVLYAAVLFAAVSPSLAAAQNRDTKPPVTPPQTKTPVAPAQSTPSTPTPSTPAVTPVPQAKPAVTPAPTKEALVPADVKALGTVREHLQNALAAIAQAQPIYGGQRGTAMGATGQALKVVENVLNSPPPVKAKPEVKAAVPAKPAVVKTQAEKLAESQAFMATGQAELEAAMKELAVATTWIQGQTGANTVKQVQTAISATIAGIKLVATPVARP
jgi:hypothetical protein